MNRLSKWQIPLVILELFFNTYVNNKYEWKIIIFIFCNFLRLIVSASDDS
jgi:hypothetical protein